MLTAEAIKAEREKRSIPQVELAKRAGIRAETLCRIEKGKQRLSKVIARAIEAALTD